MDHDEQRRAHVVQEAKSDGPSPSNDSFLALLVKAVNSNPGGEIGITISVNGLIISGLVCSITTYFEEQAELIRRLGSAENELAKLFDWLAEQSQIHADVELAEGEDGTGADAAVGTLPDFIHMRAATVHAPGTNLSLPPVLWRGRLEHVSGWSIGNFSPKPQPHDRTAS
jgi:hypothetical protein